MLDIAIESVSVHGMSEAVRAMRNPKESWGKSNLKSDAVLSAKLFNAGTEHCKHLRMVNVYVDVTAPRYWWQEFDTYRVGVEKISCSTMHKLMAREFKLSDFNYDPEIEGEIRHLETLISTLNMIRSCYDLDGNYEWVKLAKRLLPESYRQKRTVMISLQALVNIIKQRESHRLVEWRQFCAWGSNLPELTLLIGSGLSED